MSSRHIHKILVSLNNVCKIHANQNIGLWAPKVNLEKQDIKNMNKEITKLMNYLKHPQYSYLNK